MSADEPFYRTLAQRLSVGERFVLVRVSRVRGSAPREEGAAMAVGEADTLGTIGGGHLEWKAIEQARSMLASGTRVGGVVQYPLGPALGQCCGGQVELQFMPLAQEDRAEVERLAAAEAAERVTCVSVTRLFDHGESIGFTVCFTPWRIAVFGAGHVGRALVSMLAVLPCRVRWIDPREGVFPATLPPNVEALPSEAPQEEAARLPADTDALVMTHSHALDLAICEALAAREDLGLVGLIGSETKAARFRARLAARLGAAAAERIVCPVGERSIASKHPGMIAAGIVAQLASHHASRPLAPAARSVVASAATTGPAA
ncbi:MAG: xanthine dehydrogenase accessory protein XdhC [Casimicrobiaceae bacterium]|nr:xanthine dehydrogenase accessory protein XdhC [Casimicrobiaceae bacterium]MCX8097487.1 xanthine dehydrogenase accessory protein XdhC [Casimicrobiaceae bacterium]MDW8311205.1 xanthine dehydrogenase accessory protein XdhC [Burkholderiales bacterium]